MAIRWSAGRLLALLSAFLALPAISHAQSGGLVSGLLFGRYDLDATSYTFCRLQGQGGGTSPLPQAFQLPAAVETVGSSTTFTASTAATAPFRDVVAGDVLVIPIGAGVTATPVTVLRSIVSKTSSDEVVVDEAYDLGTTGVVLSALSQKCGTGEQDGWQNVSALRNVQATVQIDQMSGAGGIDVQWWCRSAQPDAKAVQYYPDNSAGAATRNYTAAGTEARTIVAFVDEASCAQIRVGMLWHTNDDGADTGADRERITVTVSGERR